MKRRFFSKRPKGLPKGYDSMLEYRLHQGPLKETKHHPAKEDLIPYSITHTYEPDFYFKLGDKFYIIETKGRFRDSAEARKYLFVRQFLKEWKVFKESGCKDIEILIIFENSKTAFPFAKKRKDGTKRTHGEWATDNGFRWLCEKSGHLEEVETTKELMDSFEVHSPV